MAFNRRKQLDEQLEKLTELLTDMQPYIDQMSAEEVQAIEDLADQIHARVHQAYPGRRCNCEKPTLN